MDVNNLIIVSDLHAGCQYGLCPPEVRLDAGGIYRHNRAQYQIFGWWRDFWGKWVPLVTRGEPFAVLFNGDTLDGYHHKNTTHWSANISDQRKVAEKLIDPIHDACQGRLYFVRGTEAHVGKAAQDEETLAENVGAIPDDEGNYSRYDLNIRIGDCLVNASHHIGTTGSTHYESSAIMKELSENFSTSARWDVQRADVIVRSHRHTHCEVSIPTARGYGISFTTPGWQAKTPFVWRLPGGRMAPPQFGGSIVRQGDEEFYTRHFVKSLPLTKQEVPR